MSDLVTKTEFAHELGVTPARVSQMVKLGLPVDASTKKVRRVEALDWVTANIERRDAESEQDGLTGARIRAANALAASREYELGIKRGKYSDRAEGLAMMRVFRRQTENVLRGATESQAGVLSSMLGISTSDAKTALAEISDRLLYQLQAASPPPTRAALFAVADLWITGDRDGESDWDEIDAATRAVRLRDALREAGGDI